MGLLSTNNKGKKIEKFLFFPCDIDGLYFVHHSSFDNHLSNHSPLVRYLVHNKQQLPRGFITDLVTCAAKDQETANKV